jgi:hypothetical protein
MMVRIRKEVVQWKATTRHSILDVSKVESIEITVSGGIQRK